MSQHPGANDADSANGALPWHWGEFALLLVAGLAGYALYFPLSQAAANGPSHDISLPVDHALALTPMWIFVYAGIVHMALLPLTVIADRRLFRRAAIAYLCAETIAFVVFLTYPVQMALRPEIPPSSEFADWGTALCYYLDAPGGCLPSLHVAMATLAALVTFRADRLVGSFAMVFALLIAVSTLLVKQHYLLDVVAGVGRSFAVYALFVHPLDLSQREPQTLRRSRRGPLLLFITYVGSIAGCYYLYHMGWAPFWA